MQHCTFEVQQATHQRGRVSTKVRHGPVQVVLDVPDNEVLLAWAANPHQRQATDIVFLNAAGGSALETLHLPAAYCVSYAEEFRHGDAGDGACVCQLTLADPGGWTIQADGPAAAFVTPTAREHGSPPVALVAAITPTIATIASKSKLVAGTPEHKAARWAAYQQQNANNPKAWSQARWEKQYAANRRNPAVGLGREKQYANAMGAVSKTLKTSLTYRQIDLYKADELYCGQLKTGKMSLNKQARTEDIPKDAELVNSGFEVEYILEKGASKPFLAALGAAGVTYKTGPQIP